MYESVGIIGVGLIGASIGLTLKKRGICRKVVGVGRRQETLAEARRIGAVDETRVGIGPALASCEIVVVCVAVDQIVETTLAVARVVSPGVILTDAGSTKGRIVRALTLEATNGVPFVGAHPIAGSDRRGPAAGSETLFDGKTCVVTPTRETDRVAVDFVKGFWSALGMNVIESDPETHDRALARTSHAPHAIAAALALALTPEDRPFVGSGLRDVTRIAAGDPSLWGAILLENQEGVLAAIRDYSKKIQALETVIRDGNRRDVEQWLTDAKRIRDALGN